MCAAVVLVTNFLTVLLHNSLHQDQQPVRASVQNEFWQCDSISTEEAAETGGAAAEEDDNTEDSQQEGKEGHIRSCKSMILLINITIIAFVWFSNESKLNVCIDEQHWKCVFCHIACVNWFFKIKNWHLTLASVSAFIIACECAPLPTFTAALHSLLWLY